MFYRVLRCSTCYAMQRYAAYLILSVFAPVCSGARQLCSAPPAMRQPLQVQTNWKWQEVTASAMAISSISLFFWTGLAAPGLSGLILSDVDLSIRRNSFNSDSAEISWNMIWNMILWRQKECKEIAGTPSTNIENLHQELCCTQGCAHNADRSLQGQPGRVAATELNLSNSKWHPYGCIHMILIDFIFHIFHDILTYFTCTNSIWQALLLSICRGGWSSGSSGSLQCLGGKWRETSHSFQLGLTWVGLVQYRLLNIFGLAPGRVQGNHWDRVLSFSFYSFWPF